MRQISYEIWRMRHGPLILPQNIFLIAYRLK